MARVRMVTRTITTTTYTVLAINLETREVKEVKAILNSTESMKQEDIEKEVKAQVENRGLAMATILSTEQTNQVWGMPESEFMKYAVPVDR